MSESSHSCTSSEVANSCLCCASENHAWDVLTQHMPSVKAAASKGHFRARSLNRRMVWKKRAARVWSKKSRKGKYKMSSYRSYAFTNMHMLPFYLMIWIHKIDSKKCFPGVHRESLPNGNKNVLGRNYEAPVHRTNSILLVKYLTLRRGLLECNFLHCYQFPELSEFHDPSSGKHSCMYTRARVCTRAYIHTTTKQGRCEWSKWLRRQMDTAEENHTGQHSYFHFLPLLLLYCHLGILLLRRQTCRHSAGHASYANVTELNLSSTLAASKLLTLYFVYSCLSESVSVKEMVTLRGKCGLGAFNTCSGMCADK